MDRQLYNPYICNIESIEQLLRYDPSETLKIINMQNKSTLDNLLKNNTFALCCP